MFFLSICLEFALVFICCFVVVVVDFVAVAAVFVTIKLLSQHVNKYRIEFIILLSTIIYQG
jgi:hypothetical protein